MGDIRAPLPASWGSSPDVLPSLQALALHIPFTGGLPPQWAGGFAKLDKLILDSASSKANTTDSSSADRPAAAPALVRLPAEWARGFRRLTLFSLMAPRLEGTLDAVWPQAFPAIADL